MPTLKVRCIEAKSLNAADADGKSGTYLWTVWEMEVDGTRHVLACVVLMIELALTHALARSLAQIPTRS